MRALVWLLVLGAGLARASEPLPAPEAAAWMQRMADAARRLPYEGLFYLHHGDMTQSMRVVNHPTAGGKSSLLVFMDGQPREVRCERDVSVTVTPDGQGRRLERRMNSRYFPDLLPADPSGLLSWYAVKLGKTAREAGLACQEVRLLPRDPYRWGYVLCAELNTQLPLRAVMVNEAGQPLLKYAFTQVTIGRSGSAPALPRQALESAEGPMPAANAPIQVKQLPPGFTRVAAVKRRLPHRPREVEHWVFSDGLTYISLFLEQADQPVEPVKGESGKGMINLLTRQVGDWRVTVLGDAPWPAVEAVAMNLAARP